MKKHQLLLCTAAALALSATAVQAKEASWPNKPVRLVVPFPPGGSTDAVARLIAERLGQKLGQTFVVENRPGAGGNIGTDAVAKAAPDGYMLTLTTSGPLANNKFLYQSMPFDPAKDLTPIVLVGEIPLVIATNEKHPAKSLKDFVAQAKAAPGKFSVGNPGNGTIGHLAFELLRHNTGTDMTAVPYRGDTPAMADLLGGAIQGIVAPITAFIPQIQAGKIRGLAVTAKTRFPGTPDVPTTVEQGFDVEASVWFAVAGPAGLPAPIVQKLNSEINIVLNSPEGRAKLEQFGAVVGGGSPERLGTLMQGESAKWERVIKAANIKIE